MAERYLFFNSTDNDIREYDAQDFATYFGGIITNGIIVEFKEELEPFKSDGFLEVGVKSGRAVLEGHMYDNTSDLILPVPNVSNANMIRYDAIMVRLNYLTRTITTFVVQGEESTVDATALANEPKPIQDATIVELMIARIRTTITGVSVTDLRDNPEYSSWASSKILPSFDDNGLADHIANTSMHVTPTEKARWNAIETSASAHIKKYNRHVYYATSSGQPPNVAITVPDLDITDGYPLGLTIAVTFTNVYPSLSPMTIDVNGGGAKPIVHADASPFYVENIRGYGGMVMLVYNGNQFRAVTNSESLRWYNATVLGGYTNITLAYAIDWRGFAHIKGAVRKNAGANSNIIMYVPSDARPQQDNVYIPVAIPMNNGYYGRFARIDVNANGALRIEDLMSTIDNGIIYFNASYSIE